MPDASANKPLPQGFHSDTWTQSQAMNETMNVVMPKNSKTADMARITRISLTPIAGFDGGGDVVMVQGFGLAVQPIHDPPRHFPRLGKFGLDHR